MKNLCKLFNKNYINNKNNLSQILAHIVKYRTYDTMNIVYLIN